MWVWLWALSVTTSFAAQSKAQDRLQLLDRWIAAVAAHHLGERDHAVEEFAALPGVDREPFTLIAWKFMGLLHDPLDKDHRPLPKESEDERVRTRLLAATLLKTTTRDGWLHRAAALHADVMMLAADLTQEADRLAPGTGRGGPQLFEARDGEFQATADRNWSLAFGRRIVADVTSPSTDDFVGAWYHATSAFMLAHGWFGELRPHLQAGERVRPSDEWILFDQGTLFEAYGSGAVQAVVQGAKLPAGTRPDVPMPTELRDTAMGYFRRLLSSGPTFVEARVRYGRLLIEMFQYDAAVQQFDTAITTATDPVTLYYAHLFALRAEAGRGRVAAAAEHGRAAAELFPTAQSADIALSIVALQRGDLTSAAAPIDVIRAMRIDGFRDDPWWEYFQGAGRASQTIVGVAWSLLK